nr:uncharacterized protein LOC114824595 [Malus domestica]
MLQIFNIIGATIGHGKKGTRKDECLVIWGCLVAKIAGVWERISNDRCCIPVGPHSLVSKCVLPGQRIIRANAPQLNFISFLSLTYSTHPRTHREKRRDSGAAQREKERRRREKERVAFPFISYLSPVSANHNSKWIAIPSFPSLPTLCFPGTTICSSEDDKNSGNKV